MSEKDLAALGRLAILLLVASGVRLAVAVRNAPVVQGAVEDRIDEVLADTERKIEEDRRRSRPLEEGERIEINRADEEALDRLPGVGPALARAILEDRTRRGAFYDAAALARVQGIGARTVERLRPHLDFRGAAPRAPGRGPDAGPEGPRGAPISLSRASAEELEALPGIGPALARRIVEERRVRPFRAVEDLVRVPGIGPAKLEGLRGAVRPP